MTPKTDDCREAFECKNCGRVTDTKDWAYDKYLSCCPMRSVKKVLIVDKAAWNAATVQPTEGHEWDRSGERCLKCGDKDWMNTPVCNGKQPAGDNREAFTEKQIADMAQAISDNGYQYEKNKSRLKAALTTPAAPVAAEVHVQRCFELLDRIEIQCKAVSHPVGGIDEIKTRIRAATNPAAQTVPQEVALEWLAELIYLREYGKIGARWAANESKEVWRAKAIALLTDGKGE
jgi:hypothetical protein